MLSGAIDVVAIGISVVVGGIDRATIATTSGIIGTGGVDYWTGIITSMLFRRTDRTSSFVSKISVVARVTIMLGWGVVGVAGVVVVSGGVVGVGVITIVVAVGCIVSIMTRGKVERVVTIVCHFRGY